jgi:PAS domain S-box-containing protein
MLVSSAAGMEELVNGLALGAVDFVSKPIQREEFLARVRTHLELGRRRARLEEQVAERAAELRQTNERLEIELAHRRRIEQALRESEARFRSLADTAPVGIWVTDADLNPTFYNQNALKFTGLTMSTLIRNEWKSLVHPDDLHAVISKCTGAVKSRSPFQFECRFRRADGEYRWALSTGIPRFLSNVYVGHIGTTTDVTDLRRNHEHQLATQKLESLSALASGIAHDFNNLLGTIFAESDFALSVLEQGSPARENVENIAMVAGHAAETVDLLLAYAQRRYEGPMVELVDLSKLVEEILDLLRPSLSTKACIKTRLAEDVPLIWANAAQMRQVVVSLLNNAAEAIYKAGGMITISTGLTHVSTYGTTPRPDMLPEGEYARLEVSDTGCGMSPEARLKAFDPFFSTKFLGRGLGLATVQGIVRSHGGSVTVVSTPGEGSTFEIFLPDAGRRQTDGSPLNSETAKPQLAIP